MDNIIFWVVVAALAVSLVNFIMLVGLCGSFAKLLDYIYNGPAEPTASRDQSYLVNLQDEQGGPQWGAHVSYRDNAVLGPNYDGITPRRKSSNPLKELLEE